jgi:hypothetical protein
VSENKKTGQSPRPATGYAEFPSPRSPSRHPPGGSSPRPSPKPAASGNPSVRPPRLGKGLGDALPNLVDEETRLYTGPLPQGPPAPPAATPASSSSHPPPAPSQAPARTSPSPRPDPLPDAAPESVRVVEGAALADWQQVWLATQVRPWTSMCILPGSPIKTDLVFRVAHALRQIGVEHLKQPLTVLDHRGVALRDVEQRIEGVTKLRAAGSKVLVVLDAVDRNTVSARYSSVVDAALLVVILGSGEIGAARKTVEAFGRERFLGTLVLRSDGTSKGPAPDRPAPAHRLAPRSAPDRPAPGSAPDRPAPGSAPDRPAPRSAPDRLAPGSAPDRPAPRSAPPQEKAERKS